MPARRIASVALLVKDYQEAREYFAATLGFDVVEDAHFDAGRRWIQLAPPGGADTRIQLVKASTPEELSRVGDQAAGSVFLILHTDDFQRDYTCYRARGVAFLEPPRSESYGTAAIFEDLYGNRWDLLQPA